MKNVGLFRAFDYFCPVVIKPVSLFPCATYNDKLCPTHYSCVFFRENIFWVFYLGFCVKVNPNLTTTKLEPRIAPYKWPHIAAYETATVRWRPPYNFADYSIQFGGLRIATNFAGFSFSSTTLKLDTMVSFSRQYKLHYGRAF